MIRDLLIRVALSLGWDVRPVDYVLFTDDDWRSIIRQLGGTIPC